MNAFDSTKQRLGSLLTEAVSGKLQLPDFQRGWVWDDAHIRSLLVSIARSFPVGSVMLLETGGEVRFAERLVEGVPPEKSESPATRLILDGQQRITSLTQVLMLDGPTKTRDGRDRPIDRFYYVDIETALLGPGHFEQAIVGVDETKQVRTNFGRDVVLDLSEREREFELMHMPLSAVFNANEWEQGLIKHDQQKFFRYMGFKDLFCKPFNQYDVPVIELKKENGKEAVCLVFEKVNTGGVPLSVFELVTASFAADGVVNLREDWFGPPGKRGGGISSRLRKDRLLKDVGPTEFLQAVTLVHTYERHREDLAAGKSRASAAAVASKREAVLNLPLTAYVAHRGLVEKAFLKAGWFLRREGFFSVKDLPYKTQLIPLATVLALDGDRWLSHGGYAKLRRWYWSGALGELYGSATDSRFALDVLGLQAWLDGGEEPQTVRDAEFRADRLDTLRVRNSAAYKAVHVLLQREGAEDLFWKSKIGQLAFEDWDVYGIDIHHVFPRKWCEDRGIPRGRMNSIINKTPLSAKANRTIGGKAPSDYLSKLQAHKQVGLSEAEMNALLATHRINARTLRDDDFEAYWADRKDALLRLVAAAMGKAPAPSSSVSDWGEEE